MKKPTLIFCIVISLFLAFAGTIAQAQSRKPATKEARTKYGIASFYALKFEGRKTANGDIYHDSALTAACNILPLNSWIKITNLKNKRSVIVRINDRMHHKNKRLVDVSGRAARELQFFSKGLAKVKVEILSNYKEPQQAAL